MENLFPDRRQIGTEAYDGLGFVDGVHRDRPYAVMNMISSVDGAARVGGTTERLASPVDVALFGALRGQVDCVFAGTGTIASERYRELARTPQRRAAREAIGLAPRPLFATVTASGKLPIGAPIFQSPDSKVVVFYSGPKPDLSCPAQVDFEPVGSVGEVPGILLKKYSVRAVLFEGGPSINSDLLSAGVVDELFLTLAPVLVGSGNGLTIVEGILPEQLNLALISVIHADDYLYLRYRVGVPGETDRPHA